MADLVEVAAVSVRTGRSRPVVDVRDPGRRSSGKPDARHHGQGVQAREPAEAARTALDVVRGEIVGTSSLFASLARPRSATAPHPRRTLPRHATLADGVSDLASYTLESSRSSSGSSCSRRIAPADCRGDGRAAHHDRERCLAAPRRSWSRASPTPSAPSRRRRTRQGRARLRPAAPPASARASSPGHKKTARKLTPHEGSGWTPRLDEIRPITWRSPRARAHGSGSSLAARPRRYGRHARPVLVTCSGSTRSAGVEKRYLTLTTCSRTVGREQVHARPGRREIRTRPASSRSGRSSRAPLEGRLRTSSGSSPSASRPTARRRWPRLRLDARPHGLRPPISAPVAGAAMGLHVRADGSFVVLTTSRKEDAFGAWTFKVTGTREGITASRWTSRSRHQRGDHPRWPGKAHAPA